MCNVIKEGILVMWRVSNGGELVMCTVSNRRVLSFLRTYFLKFTLYILIVHILFIICLD